MKKKLLVLTLATVLSFSAVACGKSEGSKKEDTTSTSSPAPSVDKVAVLSADLTEYVNLGEYKNLTITEVDATVTDEDVEAKIQSTLQNNATWTEQKKSYKAKDGNKVNIDYVGKIDGTAFDNGSAEDQELIIGNNNYISGFDTGIVGHKKGETFDMKVTFPETYSANEELAGKEAVFTVTLNSVSTQNVPELTDKYVKDTLSKTSKTVKEYRKEVKKSLEADAKASKESEEIKNAVQAAMNNAEIKEYPKEQMQYYEELVSNYYTNIASYYYGIELKEFYTQSGYTDESWQSDVITKSAQDMLKQVMVIQAIAKAESLEITDEEYQTELKTYLTNYNVSSEDDLKEQYGEDAVLSIKDELLYNKVGAFLVKNDKLEKATASTEPTATTKAE